MECPYCGVRISAYLSQPIEEDKAELHHDTPYCREFWDRHEDEVFLDELRGKLRQWPDQPTGKE